jgi:hypothetical protein
VGSDEGRVSAALVMKNMSIITDTVVDNCDYDRLPSSDVLRSDPLTFALAYCTAASSSSKLDEKQVTRLSSNGLTMLSDFLRRFLLSCSFFDSSGFCKAE